MILLSFNSLGSFSARKFFLVCAMKPEAEGFSFHKVLSNFARNSEGTDLSISLTIDTCGIVTFIQVKSQAILFSEESLFLGMCVSASSSTNNVC